MRKKIEQLFPKLLVEVHRTALGRSVPDNPELSESDLLLGMTPVPILQALFNVVQTATDPSPPLLVLNVYIITDSVIHPCPHGMFQGPSIPLKELLQDTFSSLKSFASIQILHQHFFIIRSTHPPFILTM